MEPYLAFPTIFKRYINWKILKNINSPKTYDTFLEMLDGDAFIKVK